MTAAVASPVHVRPTARRTGPSLPAAVGLEVRKSLSTRSGLALVAAATLLAPAAIAIAAGTANQPLDSVVGPLVVTGMLTALVLVSLGVLSTAGEWSHGSVQTTFLLEPRRGRVMAAKAAAVALMGAVVAVVAAGISALVLVAMEPSASWDGAGRAMLHGGGGRCDVRADRCRRRSGRGQHPRGADRHLPAGPRRAARPADGEAGARRQDRPGQRDPRARPGRRTRRCRSRSSPCGSGWP